jgi:hypothetical protein
MNGSFAGVLGGASAPAGGGVSTPSAAAGAAGTSSAAAVRSRLQEFWGGGDDYAPLRWAGGAVLGCLRDDEARVDADLYRRISSTTGSNNGSGRAPGGGGAASGTSNGSDNGGYRLIGSAAASSPGEMDASSAASLSSLQAAVPGIVHVRSVPLPSLLRDQLRTGARRYSFLGILAPARLGWMSVDDKLWLWKVPSATGFGGVGGANGAGGRRGGGEPVLALPAPGGAGGGDTNEPPILCQFQVPSGQPIVTVALVPPKPGT